MAHYVKLPGTRQAWRLLYLNNGTFAADLAAEELAPTWWRKITDSCKLPSDLYTYIMAYMCPS